MTNSLFIKELQKYISLLISKKAQADEFALSDLVEEVDNVYYEIPKKAGSSVVRFSKELRDEVEIDGLRESEVPYGKTPVDELTARLAAEVEEKIQQLVMANYPVDVIENWLQKAVKLSRVQITKDYRILLPDYNKEIKLRQLPKTLFLFFLKHPEGCRLKELSGHRDELLAIYRKLTNQDDEAQVLSSIDALTDPLSNSFSEKCAAVKLAFLKEIPDRIAKNYYIQGPQGGAKGISLDRNMVEWEE